jgi:tRNA (mo5U34)-methyltransferase
MQSHLDWLRAQVEKEKFWFHRFEFTADLVTPGWSDPKKEKLPYFGLPEDMSGMRVLDVGCADGFFSFEAERRGAREVIAVDSHPDSVRRFNICRAAFASQATAYLTNVYDLSARSFGTFDLIMFFGVLYHLRHPILALEKIYDVCAGTLLLQSAYAEDSTFSDQPMAKFHPCGIESGPPGRRAWDRTVFWIPNSACIRDMLAHVGFVRVEKVSEAAGFVFRAQAPSLSLGTPPDLSKSPWR